ncbi:MAG: TonB-dependent receptor, partial [Sandaracinobacteroides sp.]
MSLFDRATRLGALLMASSALASAAIASTLTGTVADSSGVRPLPGAEVRIASLGRVANADSVGGFRFTGLPAGTYQVTARFAGAGEQSQTVTVGSDGTMQLNFTLAPEGTEIETILVLGQQANLLSSIQRQRSADNVATVLTRDAIGQFPDQNVAESLRRAPGINVLNDQGEGRFVSVRGLSPELNSASINGNRVLSTGGDERAVALDVIPSELVESIQIQKSLTPDMDADTIGGSLDIRTTSAFDRKTGFVALKAEGAYNQLSSEWSPKFGVDFSTRITEDFGIAGGFSWNRRRFSTDNIEASGWNETDSGIVYAEDVEYRDYDVERVRWGGNLSLDFRPADSTTLYVRGLYSKFDDTELRRRLIFGMDEEPAAGTGDTATFDSADGRIEVRRDIKDRGEAQSIATVSAGGKTEVGPWKLLYDVAWSYADQQENGSTDPLRFRQRFQSPGALGVTFDYSSLQIPTYAINFGEAAFLDPSRYRMSLLERTTREDATDREWSFRSDIGRAFELESGEFELQAGGRARLREKEQRFVFDVFDGYDGSFTLADVLGRQSYGLANIGPTPDLGKTRDFLKANIANFELDQLETDFQSNAENYRASEDVLAAYMLGRFDNDVFRVIGGLRMERTDIGLVGNRLELVEEGGTANGVVLDEDTLFISPVRVRRGYTDWLPSLNVRANASDDIVARLGMFRSLKRPSFGQLAPRFLIEENDEGERSGEFGNPDLKPYRAWNFDATAEYYFAPKAVLQGGVFYKVIDDFIVVEFRENGSFAGIDFNEALVPINGDKATVFGVELGYSQALTGLPAPFDGLLVNLNYTYTDAKGDVLTDSGETRRIPLPAASKHTFNAVLGYDKGALSFRIAGAFRDGYLDELGGSAEEDRYVRSHFQLD